MTTFKFGRGMRYAKFMHQIKGEIIDVVEGYLLDSLLVAGKRGYYFMKETYQNSNSSVFTVYFAAYKDVDGVNTLFNMWDTFAGVDVVETA